MPTRSGHGGTDLVGSLTVNATILQGVQQWAGSAAFAGAGGLSAVAKEFLNSTALFSGAGLLAASAGLSRNISAVFAGAGGFAADLIFPPTIWQGTAAWTGGGTLVASTLQFVAGIYDETGTATATDTLSEVGKFTELEFGLQLDRDNLATGDVLEFRVYLDGIALDSYVTPSITIAAEAWAATAAFAGAGNLSASASIVAAALYINATLSGAGQFSVTPQLFAAASETLAGAGLSSATAQLSMSASAALSGAGSLTVDLAKLANIWSGEGNFAGLGNLTATVNVLQSALATFTGAGSVAVDSRLFLGTTESLAGSGSLVANTIQQMLERLAFSGAGSLAISGIILGRIDASVLFQGAGLVTISTRQIAQVTAAFAGSGLLSIAPQLWMPGRAALSGAGLLSASAQFALAAKATFAGVGNLTAAATELLSPRATFAGAGLQTVNIKRTVNLLAESFAGTGLLTATAKQKLGGFANFDGSGLLSATPRLQMRSLAAFAGAGSMSIDLGFHVQSLLGQAAFDGIGGLDLTGVLSLPSNADFAGSGSLAVDGLRFINLSEQFFAGTGSLIADVEQALGAFALYGGQGNLIVSTTMTSARDYWLICSGIEIQPEILGEASMAATIAGSLELTTPLAGKPALRKC